MEEQLARRIAARGYCKATITRFQTFLDCDEATLLRIPTEELIAKQDGFTSKAFQMERDLNAKPSLEEFLKYLEKRALALENAEQGCTREGIKVAAHLTPGATCSYCKYHDHKLFQCKKFKLLPAKERVTFCNNKRLCFICLGAHKGKCRFHFRCADCKGNHNSLLHCNSPEPAPPVTLTGNINNNVLLPTARVKIFSREGREYHIKILLDSGSQVSLVTSKLIKILGLTPKQSNTTIIGISNARNTVNYCIPLEIHSLKMPFKTTLNCHVVNQITCKLPQNEIDISKANIPNNITLADEQFNIPSEIHILMGADGFFQTLLPSQQSMSLELSSCSAQPPSNLPVSQQESASFVSSNYTSHQNSSTQLQVIPTYFGHVVGGGLQTPLYQPTCSKVVLKCESNLHDTISKFWSHEKVPELYYEQTSEQDFCEQIFQSSVKLENNQFQVAIPLKLPLENISEILGESFHLALKRFLNLEKRLHLNYALFIEYQKFINEYLSLNHSHYVDIESYELSKQPTYFLPHHAVISKNSKTTKLRTVFDGSMKTTKKISLNDLQLNGPVVQRDLFDIIMLFRLGKYTFTADIKHMFRNIKVDPAFTSLQNILWRDNPSDAIKCIRLDTVTYGLKSSSYLATRCLNELANRYAKSYPLASDIIKNHTYVDDIIYSTQNLDTAIAAKDQLCNMLKLGSFHTHKWASNDNKILSNIPLSEQHFSILDLQKEAHNMKALGIQINIKDDNFIISSPEPFDSSNITKRKILSYIGRFYDPLGFVGPIIVTAKAIIQKLWLQKIDWNSAPPLDIQQEWLQFIDDLLKMEPIILSRNIDISNANIVELIGFADASGSTAYGCCIYLRVNISGNIKLYLLCSKSRINPVQKKGMTIPRLELNAALLLSKLMVKTHDALKLKLNIHRVCLFSDSKIVLAWLNTEVTKLQAYIANRVSVIQQATTSWTWLYVNTKDNPADLISRGVRPSELQDCVMWWHGPQFLHSEYNFNSYKAELPDTLPEVKPCLALSINTTNQCLKPIEYIFKRLYNYSDIQKIIRLLAYILRFLNNINKRKDKINTKYLKSSEIHNALMAVIKHEQSIYFKSEINTLLRENNLKGNLASLHPFIDNTGLLRVGGRLHHAAIPNAQKHPVLLPKDSIITSLIIKSEHERLLHAGPKLLLSNLNQRFWIINGILEVKKVTHKCITCFRNKATVAKQLMGSLPASRVNVTSRPFEKIGVDFAGPIQVKLSRIRRSVVGKGYICVIVCFTTKAVHLELASDLTTETFLACFRRFISRRGLPTEIHCDNASTFKCAKSQLTELYSLQASQSHKAKVYEFAAQQGIQFHFIPSYSPTFAGLWEAAVKSTKYHLKRILHKNILTYEQLNTVLTEIECVLNSRPLLPLSSHPDDYCYLTPGHFIIGSALTMYPEHNVTNIPQNRLKFWQLCTNLKQLFWKVWHKYYLNVLQNRPKWQKDECNVKEGSLVILKEDNIQPLCWPMARIVKLFPGHDGKVRAVEVRTPNNKTHIRAINKICILPID